MDRLLCGTAIARGKKRGGTTLGSAATLSFCERSALVLLSGGILARDFRRSQPFGHHILRQSQQILEISRLDAVIICSQLPGPFNIILATRGTKDDNRQRLQIRT